MDQLKNTLYELIIMGDLVVPNEEDVDGYLLLKEAVKKGLLPVAILKDSQDIFN